MNATPPTLAGLRAERDRLAAAPFALDAGLDPEQEKRELARQRTARELELARLDELIAAQEGAEAEAPRSALQAEDPLAPGARDRVRYLIRRLENVVTPADSRDYGIALAAVAAALEDLERLDGRAFFHRSILAGWERQLRRLLELLGTPAAAPREQQRIYHDALEGMLDDLARAARELDGVDDDSLGYPIRAGLGDVRPGLFDRVRELERIATAQTERAEKAEARVAELEAEVLEAGERPEPSE